MDDLLRRVLDARVADVLPDATPLHPAPVLSERIGHSVLLKREDLTPVFSFKLRGAYNRLAQLTDTERGAGVIAASAGNHAQGVAYGARKLGIAARIVMPRTTPAIKVVAVRRLGAHVDLIGDNYTDAAAACATLAAETHMTLVPPFDDLDVIAGQGTIGLEVLRQAPRDLAAILVPVGGGGLAAGVASVVKALRPQVRVIGVQPDDSDAMTRSLAAGHRITLPTVGIFADGVAVKQVGEHTFPLCQRYLDACITVSVDEICAAIQDGFEDTRSILEPAGALAIAGVRRLAERGELPDGTIVAVTSGANMNFARLGYVAERVQVGAHHEALLAVTIPERPGAFLDFCRAVGARNVTEFNYRLADRQAAHIFVGVEVENAAETHRLIDVLTAAGYACLDLSHDDLAATHVRHMVGGRAITATDELFLSFEFPERPGALLQFLTALDSRWNLSLFHYRNYGAAFGRVLCGLEVPLAERPDLRRRLETLGFSYTDESDNPAARAFLR
jgi:threonine dehydratase